VAPPAPVPAPAPEPAPVPVLPTQPAVAEPPAYAGDPRFGGAPAAPAGPPAPAWAAATMAPTPPPASATAALRPVEATRRPVSHLVLAGVLVLLLLGGAVVFAKSMLGGSGGSPDDGSAGPGGLSAPGNPQVAAMKSDVLSIATAEETLYTDTQAFATGSSAGGSLQIGGHPVRLSAAGETVSVVVSPSRTGYCIRAARTPAGGGTPQVVVYVSTQGGLQPSLVTACPATF
jgi:hypothetical protein